VDLDQGKGHSAKRLSPNMACLIFHLEIC
ncbi:hypothetical protein GCK32_012913, partial [Trichostrongylus colubriformis]